MINPTQLSALTFREIAKALQQLTDDQFEALADGRARVELHFDEKAVKRPIKKARPPRTTKLKGPTVQQAVDEIGRMSRSDEVFAYLDKHYDNLTVPNLRELAEKLGSTVSIGSKAKKREIVDSIIDGTAGFVESSEALLPDGFSGH